MEALHDFRTSIAVQRNLDEGPVQVKVQRGALNLGMHLKDGPHFLLVLGVEDGVVKDRTCRRAPG